MSGTATMQVVQRCIGPTIGLCTDMPLYARCNDFATYAHRRREWRLARGGSVTFDTYFNGLSIQRWKDTSPLQDLHAEITFQGRILVGLHRMQVGPVATLVDEIELASSTETMRRWAVDDWPHFDDGILYLSVHALDDSTLSGFRFVTTTRPARPVRLGVCITHYDRKPQIVPAIARLKRELLDDPDFVSHVGVVVIDNSRNLEPSEVAGATLLPNPNLGGAGGFARGMMHLLDDGAYTHALFMDDDASCEVEAIRRTVALLAYAGNPRTAVSGAMLRTAEPYRQFERGARFEGLCRPLRSGVDLRDRGVLAWNEREQNGDYGGWWFFAFALHTARGYPYPYFVRGDDVDFSLRNDFHMVHANGIASWQDDFAFKQSPQTHYLDVRSHLLHMLHGFRGGRLRALVVALRLFLLPNLAGQYEQAAATVLAMDDVARGPLFFRDNADLAEPRRRVQALMRDERMRPMDAAALRDADIVGLPEPRWRGFVRHATANGHLVPQFLFSRRAVRLGKGFVLPLRNTFRRRRIVVYDEFSGMGMTLVHSKRRFFANLLAFARAASEMTLRFESLSAAYRDAYPHLTSDAYWRAQFGIGPQRPVRNAATMDARVGDAADPAEKPLARAA